MYAPEDGDGVTLAMGDSDDNEDADGVLVNTDGAMDGMEDRFSLGAIDGMKD